MRTLGILLRGFTFLSALAGSAAVCFYLIRSGRTNEWQRWMPAVAGVFLLVTVRPTQKPWLTRLVATVRLAVLVGSGMLALLLLRRVQMSSYPFAAIVGDVSDVLVATPFGAMLGHWLDQFTIDVAPQPPCVLILAVVLCGWAIAWQCFELLSCLIRRSPVRAQSPAVAAPQSDESEERDAMTVEPRPADEARLTSEIVRQACAAVDGTVWRDFDSKIDALNELLRDERWSDAAKAAGSYVKQMPLDGRGWTALGEVQLRLGLFTESFDSFMKAQQLSPGQPDVYDNLGRLHQAAGRPAAAIAQFDLALAIDPFFDVARRNLLQLTTSTESTLPAPAFLRHTAENIQLRRLYKEWGVDDVSECDRCGRLLPLSSELAERVEIEVESDAHPLCFEEAQSEMHPSDATMNLLRDLQEITGWSADITLSNALVVLQTWRLQRQENQCTQLCPLCWRQKVGSSG
jgi:tetratricopeptide (TPR) repeat protein